MRPSVRRAIQSGFVATLVMTVIMYIAPSMVPPRMDIAAMFGSTFGWSWWAGLMVHFINGTIIFSLIYVYLLYSALPGKPWVKGTLWGLTLWFLAQLMIMPMLGVGFFSANMPGPGKAVIGSLMAHLLYGVILGTMLGAIAGREAYVATSGAQEIQTLGLSIPSPSSGGITMAQRRRGPAKFNAALLRERPLTGARRDPRLLTGCGCG